jgi:hypothetical protein
MGNCQFEEILFEDQFEMNYLLVRESGRSLVEAVYQ